jgi:hypothetical protein
MEGNTTTYKLFKGSKNEWTKRGLKLQNNSRMMKVGRLMLGNSYFLHCAYLYCQHSPRGSRKNDFTSSQGKLNVYLPDPVPQFKI